MSPVYYGTKHCECCSVLSVLSILPVKSRSILSGQASLREVIFLKVFRVLNTIAMSWDVSAPRLPVSRAMAGKRELNFSSSSSKFPKTIPCQRRLWDKVRAKRGLSAHTLAFERFLLQIPISFDLLLWNHFFSTTLGSSFHSNKWQIFHMTIVRTYWLLFPNGFLSWTSR